MNPTIPDDAAERPSTARLTESDRHDLLSDRRRRVVLDVLRARVTPISLDSLAEAVAVRETDCDTPGPETVDTVALTLHHNHLPRMANVGVLDYDAESRRVE
jgi:hypothetical protein